MGSSPSKHNDKWIKGRLIVPNKPLPMMLHQKTKQSVSRPADYNIVCVGILGSGKSALLNHLVRCSSGVMTSPFPEVAVSDAKVGTATTNYQVLYPVYSMMPIHDDNSSDPLGRVLLWDTPGLPNGSQDLMSKADSVKASLRTLLREPLPNSAAANEEDRKAHHVVFAISAVSFWAGSFKERADAIALSWVHEICKETHDLPQITISVVITSTDVDKTFLSFGPSCLNWQDAENQPPFSAGHVRAMRDKVEPIPRGRVWFMGFIGEFRDPEGKMTLVQQDLPRPSDPSADGGCAKNSDARVVVARALTVSLVDEAASCVGRMLQANVQR